jgi:hypothetical protein
VSFEQSLKEALPTSMLDPHLGEFIGGPERLVILKYISKLYIR